MARDQQRGVASKRVARDGFFASLFAFLVSAPIIFAGGAVIVAAIGSAMEQQSKGDGDAVTAGMLIVLIGVLLLVVARWTFDSVRAALMRQRVQAMWLRRFQSERGAFRTSRVIDRLSRYGVSAITLQDRDVQLSIEQRRNRLAPVFWILFIPLVLFLGFAVWTSWENLQQQTINAPTPDNFRDAIGHALGSFLVLIFMALVLAAVFLLGFGATVIIVMLIALLAGPIGTLFSRNRDDYPKLPKLLARIERGKRPRGSTVLRISDANWRDAVTSSLGVADVAIIDLSNVTDHIIWEIGQAVAACGPEGLVFISSTAPTQQASAAVRAATGRDTIDIVQYPQKRGKSPKRFAKALRRRIYAAADARANINAA